MASSYRAGPQLVASFRGIGMVKQQRRRVRLKPEDLHGDYTAKAATGYANECERYCRILERKPQRPEDIAHAERIRAILPEQAIALRAGLPPPSKGSRSRALTLADAAQLHPSTQRDGRNRPTEAVLNLRHLAAFAAFAGITTVSAVDIGQVLRWVAKMKADGVSWEGRRHRLLYLRRACRMALTQGLPDALAGLRIDHREEGDAPPIEAWTLPELARGALRLTDQRALVAMGLGAFLGLRPSECFRLIVGDLRGDVLDVGKRKAKTRASRRTLPLPPTVARWCAVLVTDRQADEPLIAAAAHRQRARAFTEETWAHWLGPLLATAIGRALPPKCLRKSFATWAPSVLAGRDVERYMGHASAFLAQVSSSAYQADRAAEDLKPAAVLIETRLVAEIEAERLRNSTTKPEA